MLAFVATKGHNRFMGNVHQHICFVWNASMHFAAVMDIFHREGSSEVDTGGDGLVTAVVRLASSVVGGVFFVGKNMARRRLFAQF